MCTTDALICFGKGEIQINVIDVLLKDVNFIKKINY